MEVDSTMEVHEGGFMADARWVERHDRYVSFNPIDDYRGRVENMKESFNNLPITFTSPYSV